MLPFAVLGVVAALYLLQSVDTRLLLKAMAAFIIFYAMYSLSGKAPEGAHSRWWAISAGGLGGLIGTAFGTGGPFYVAYLQMRKLDKSQFRATFAAIFLLDGANRLAGYFLTGILTLEFLKTLAMALPVMLVGIYLGGKVPHHDQPGSLPPRHRHPIAVQRRRLAGEMNAIDRAILARRRRGDRRRRRR